MEEGGRVVAGVVACFICQFLLSLPITVSGSNSSFSFSFSFLPPPLVNDSNPDNSHHLLHLVSTSHIAAASLLLPKKKKKKKKKKKRKRQQQASPSSCSSSGSGRVNILPPPPPSPDHFPMSFRMSSSTFEWLSGLLDPLLDCRDPSGSSLRLPGPTRLAIALSRLATAAPYPDIARRFSVSDPTARFCTKRLCRVLCTNFRFWLSFLPPPPPNTDNSGNKTSTDTILSDCSGAIACARFELGDGRAVAAQIVADASSRILSLAAGFRMDRSGGDNSVDNILRNSTLFKDLQSNSNGLLPSGEPYLVGGVGYPLLPWLMVPYANPAAGSVEEDFNAELGLMCRPVRRAISSLRGWRVLTKLEEEENDRMAVAYIGTCALLHNVLLMREDYSALSDQYESIEDQMISENLPEECPSSHMPEGLDKASILRTTLAMRVRAVRDSRQNL